MYYHMKTILSDIGMKGKKTQRSISEILDIALLSQYLKNHKGYEAQTIGK